MASLRPLVNLAFWLGAALLAVAIGLLIRSQTTPPTDGFADLAAIVSAMLAAALSGIPFAAFLLLARHEGAPYPAAWKLGIATGGALLALIAAVAIGQTAIEAPNWGLLVFVVIVALLSFRGLMSAGRMFRARAA